MTSKNRSIKCEHISYLCWHYAIGNVLCSAVSMLKMYTKVLHLVLHYMCVLMVCICKHITFFTFASWTFCSFSALVANRSSCFTVNYKTNLQITIVAYSANYNKLLQNIQKVQTSIKATKNFLDLQENYLFYSFLTVDFLWIWVHTCQ